MKFLYNVAITITIFLLLNSVKNLNYKKFLNTFTEENNLIKENEFRELKNLIDKKIIFLNEDLELKNYASISNMDNTYKLNNKKQNESNLIAEVYFHKTLFEKGWDKLSLNTFRVAGEGKNNSPFLQAYMGGYLEGRLTFIDTNTFLTNMENNLNRQDPNLRIVKSIKKFYEDVDFNMYNKIEKFNEIYKSEKEKEYYYKIYIFYAQLHGLLEGHNKSVELNNDLNFRKLTIGDLNFLQADGEIPELMRYFNYKINGRIYNLGDRNYFRDVFRTPDDNLDLIWGRIMWTSRCSAMMKIVRDDKGKMIDLFAGHTAWSEYTELYRTYKQ